MANSPNITSIIASLESERTRRYFDLIVSNHGIRSPAQLQLDMQEEFEIAVFTNFQRPARRSESL